MTSYVSDELFWEMFERTPIWPNIDFGQLLLGQMGGSFEKHVQSGAKKK